MGGLCKTVEYKGFRCDIGGHRFFTKNKEIQALWENTLGSEFLLRQRLSRIYYRGKFFYYPLRLGNALSGLGRWNQQDRPKLSKGPGFSGQSGSEFCRLGLQPVRQGAVQHIF